MRSYINVVASLFEDDRPEDEWFSANFGLHDINVGEARRLVASGKVQAVPYDMPVKEAGIRLINLNPNEFGSGSMESRPGVFGGAAVDRRYTKTIPDEKMAEPLLLVMWNEYEGTKAAFPDRPAALKGIDPQRSYPILVDGNHRLTRRFIEGDEGTINTLVVSDWADVAKFTYVQGRRLTEAKAAPPAWEWDGEPLTAKFHIPNVGGLVAKKLGAVGYRSLPPGKSLPWGKSYMGGAGYFIVTGSNRLFLDADIEKGTIYLSQISVEKPGDALGRAAMEALREIAKEKGLKITVYKVTNDGFFRGFPWLRETSKGVYEADFTAPP
jgi:hypothetical protein